MDEKVKKALEDFETRIKAAEENNDKLKTQNEELTGKLKKYEEAGFNSFLSGNYKASENSDEKRAMRYFGVGHVKQLLEVNVSEERYKRVPEELKHTVIQFKKEFQNARFISQLFYDGKMDKIGSTEDLDKFGSCPNILESYYAKEILVPRLKAFGTSVVGGGAEWIPTAIASTYIPEFQLERKLVAAFKDIPMPTSPYELPTTSGLTTARKGTEGVTATQSNFNTGKLNFSAKKFLEYYILPEELREDSIIPILELARQELTEAHERAFETSCINGVELPLLVNHIDSDTDAGAVDLAEKQWTGLRKKALDNSANGGVVGFGNAVVSDANLALMRQKLGKFGVDPTNLVWLVGAVGYLQMLNTDKVVTVDKMGPNATILTGSLGKYDGIDILVSGFVREDLNATGVYDGVTVDRAGLLLLNKTRFYFGTRRPIRLALREAKSADDRYEIASYSRTDFVGHAQSASEVSVSYGVNIAK